MSKELVANLPKVGNEENKIEQEITETRLQSTSVKMGRGQDPPSKTGCNKDYLARLEQLDNEDYMHLFLSHVGWELVTKLKGFPFAVKIVGCLLRNRLIVDYWERSLESIEWEFHSVVMISCQQ